MSWLWVALGSALGGAARYWMSGAVASRWGEAFPVGTLAVNIVGSAIIGVIAAAGEPEGRLWMSSAARDFVMLGVLGGFTTFSSFSLQTLNLARDGEWLWAGANIVASVVLCLVAVWLGYAAGQWVSNRA